MKIVQKMTKFTDPGEMQTFLSGIEIGLNRGEARSEPKGDLRWERVLLKAHIN